MACKIYIFPFIFYIKNILNQLWKEQHLFRYNTIKGDMSAVIGDVWTMVEPLTTISWDSPRNVGF